MDLKDNLSPMSRVPGSPIHGPLATLNKRSASGGTHG